MIKLCIFDLDGTLLDTLPTIAYYCNYSLKEFGLPEIETQRYNYLAGNGAKVLVERMLDEVGADKEKYFEILGMCENLDLYGLKTRVYTTQECQERYFEIFGKKGTYDLNASGVVNGMKVYQRILIRKRVQ